MIAPRPPRHRLRTVSQIAVALAIEAIVIWLILSDALLVFD
jgi:hypothetical protein